VIGSALLDVFSDWPLFSTYCESCYRAPRQPPE
jgi:hypothetical protein